MPKVEKPSFSPLRILVLEVVRSFTAKRYPLHSESQAVSTYFFDKLSRQKNLTQKKQQKNLTRKSLIFNELQPRPRPADVTP